MSLTQQILGSIVSAVAPMVLFRLLLKLDQSRKARKERAETQGYATAHH
jgi:hypothetical protein